MERSWGGGLFPRQHHKETGIFFAFRKKSWRHIGQNIGHQNKTKGNTLASTRPGKPNRGHTLPGARTNTDTDKTGSHGFVQMQPGCRQTRDTGPRGDRCHPQAAAVLLLSFPPLGSPVSSLSFFLGPFIYLFFWRLPLHSLPLAPYLVLLLGLEALPWWPLGASVR